MRRSPNEYEYDANATGNIEHMRPKRQALASCVRKAPRKALAGGRELVLRRAVGVRVVLELERRHRAAALLRPEVACSRHEA